MEAPRRRFAHGLAQADASAAGFDVRDLVSSAIESAAFEAKNKQLTLKRSVGPLVPARLHGDSACLTRLLSEFVTSAVRLAQRGEISLKAELEDETPKDAVVRFTISDSTNDIWPELIGEFFEVFDYFGRAEPHPAGGSPGLMNCRRLVQAIGGNIHLESQPGEGSRLCLVVALLKNSGLQNQSIVIH